MANKLNNPQAIVDRLIEIEGLLKPLEEEKEALKVQLRQFGPSAYNGVGGFVTVANPVLRVKTGEKYTLVQDVFLAQTKRARENLIKKGIVTMEEVWSRAMVSKVEIKRAAV